MPPPYRADRILCGGRVRRRKSEQEEMGLHERLLEEREKEERRRGRPPGASYGSDSPVLDRRLANAPKDRPTGYVADLSTMHRLISEGPRSPWTGMRLGSLRSRYREEYAELTAEARGHGELL
jgi:hypothetical protein